MTPNNTNHISLQVYFDFLEENNHDTDELRENLIENKQYWCFEWLQRNGAKINMPINYVGYISSVGSSGNYINVVGGCNSNVCVGADLIFANRVGCDYDYGV